MFAKAATIAAHGQDSGPRSRRRRALWASRAGRAGRRYRSAFGSHPTSTFASPVRASSRIQATRSAAIWVSITQVWLIANSLDGNRPSPESLACRIRSSTRA